MLNLTDMRIVNFTALCCGILGLCLTAAAQPSPTVPVPAPNAIPRQSIPPPQPVITPINNPVMPNYPTLVFDAETKQYDPRPGEMVAPFTFRLTNVWTNEVRIDQVKASCGCTTAKLPETPWHIPPGGSGEVAAQVNLAGKPPGMVTKTLTFFTSVGNRIVNLKVNIPPAGAAMAGMSPEDRKAAMARAIGDPQAIFKADCVKCHVEKGARAMGQDLYAADCGICHESPHRDTGVPDLHALKVPTSLEYWRTIIAFGKPHTTMPGFALNQGGPLTDEQITSLATYIDRTISHHVSTAPMTNAAAAPSYPSATRAQ
jgi:mono/diheme cytochrome c family protein